MNRRKLDPTNRIVYLSDKDTYFDRRDRKAISAEAAMPRLMAMGIESYEKAKAILDMAKQFGIESSEVIEKKAAEGRVSSLNELYEIIKPVIGLSKYSTDKASFLYEVDERGECKFAGQNKVDRFEELIVLNSEAMDIIDIEYNERPELKGYSKSDVIRELFDRFKVDRVSLFREEPPLLAYETGPAFKVLDTSVIEQGEHPTWDEFTNRLDYPETFKAYVWSLFEPTNFGRQALWIYGEGNDGKSSVINALVDFYGRSHTLAMNTNSIKGDFFFGQAYGKRLAIYMDCKNSHIIQTEKIKSLLGRDNVAINNKHDKIFTGQVYSKLFIGSNMMPTITYSDRSERTRLLLLKVSKYSSEDGDPDFEHKLKAEIPAFLYSCRESYGDECPMGMSLRVPKKMAEDIELNCVTEDSELIEEFCSEWLEFDEDYDTPERQIKDALSAYLAKHWNGNKRNSYTYKDLINELKKKNCDKHRPREGDKRVRKIKGVRIKKEYRNE